jgi:hypothetical protein
MSSKSHYLSGVGCLLWFGACALFFGVSLVLGGAAITGKIDAGHYFLGAHGN